MQAPPSHYNASLYYRVLCFGFAVCGCTVTHLLARMLQALHRTTCKVNELLCFRPEVCVLVAYVVQLSIKRTQQVILRLHSTQNTWSNRLNKFLNAPVGRNKTHTASQGRQQTTNARSSGTLQRSAFTQGNSLVTFSFPGCNLQLITTGTSPAGRDQLSQNSSWPRVRTCCKLLQALRRCRRHWLQNSK